MAISAFTVFPVSTASIASTTGLAVTLAMIAATMGEKGEFSGSHHEMVACDGVEF